MILTNSVFSDKKTTIIIYHHQNDYFCSYIIAGSTFGMKYLEEDSIVRALQDVFKRGV